MILSLLANVLLQFLCLQAAFAESTINATKELGSIEKLGVGDLEVLLREMDTNKTGTIPTTVLTDMKKGAEIIMANVTELGEKEEDGKITIKKPNKCANEEEKILHSYMREIDTNKTETIPTTVLTDMKKGAEIIMANVTELGEKEEDGKITIKKPNECANEEETILHIYMSKYDEDNNGKLSLPEQNKMKEIYESTATQLDGFIKKLAKDERINIKEFVALIKEVKNKKN